MYVLIWYCVELFRLFVLTFSECGHEPSKRGSAVSSSFQSLQHTNIIQQRQRRRYTDAQRFQGFWQVMLTSNCHHKARQNDTTLRAHQKLVHCTFKPNVLSPVGLMVLQTVNVHINKQFVTGLAQETQHEQTKSN